MKTLNKLLFTFILLFSTNLLASYVATITAIKGNATIQRDTQTIVAELGLQLEQKDIVKTETNTKLQLIFKDETIISLGHSTNFSIEEYLFEDSSEPIARFGMFKGAIRTITGKIGKIAPDKFSVSTKTATIGIRGTNFTTLVKNDSFNVYCTYGEISVSVNDQQFTVPQGYLLNINQDGKISTLEFSAKDIKVMKEENFKAVLKKSTSATKGNIVATEQNGEHLNITIKDEMEIVIQDISEINGDNILNPGADVITDPSIIAQYSMNHANYLGSYTTTQNATTLPSIGDAKLSVNFAQNSAYLELGNFANPSATVAYDIKHINSNTFSGVQTNGDGTATGAFYGTTGNIVKGGFVYSEHHEDELHNTAMGNYNVVSTQKLH